MIIDDEQKRLHWQKSKRTMVAAAVMLMLITLAVPIVAPLLETYIFLRFPMAYFLVVHAAIFAILALVYWFISAQERTDGEISILTPL